MTRPIDRRDFMKSAAAAGAAAAVLPGALAQEEGAPAKAPPKSRVVEVSAPGVMIKGKRPDGPRVRRMVEQGILSLTGEKDLAAAWSCFVKPDDVVGIKINCGGGKVIGSHRDILECVIDGARLAGVPDPRIVVWEQVETFFKRFYLRQVGIKPEEGEVRYLACTPELTEEYYVKGKPLPGFDTEPLTFPWGKVKVAELVAKELTAIINIPVVKDHACAGVTLALKNISHAVVDVPWLCHDNCCDPHIADIVNIPAVRDKLRLHILDGLLGLADGGPSFRSWKPIFVKEKILLSADPVAVDTLGAEWVVKAREEMDYPPLEEAINLITKKPGRTACHIATAAARGLGTNDRSRMEIVPLEIPPLEEADLGEDCEEG